jgi:hypothetical protein
MKRSFAPSWTVTSFVFWCEFKNAVEKASCVPV